jgi:pyridoxamine 5'-phosphate oxidase
VLIPDVSDPIALFGKWLEEARRVGVPLPERVALATVNPQGQPSVRMVLLKQCDQDGFVFYTNLRSRKAADLTTNPRAALCFHWPETGKQVRVEGRVELVGDAEADAYFASRPRESQLGAWASQQSAVLTSREELEQRFSDVERLYDGRNVPRPPHWSGYRLKPDQIQFWMELPRRMHDRILYCRGNHSGWTRRHLYP